MAAPIGKQRKFKCAVCDKRYGLRKQRRFGAYCSKVCARVAAIQAALLRDDPKPPGLAFVESAGVLTLAQSRRFLDFLLRRV